MDDTEKLLLQLREFVAIMLRRKVLIAAFVAASLAVVAIIAASLPPTYRSSAQIMFDPRGLQVVTNDVLPRSESSDVHDTIIDNNTRLMSSDSVLEDVVRREGLQYDEEFVPPPSARNRLISSLIGRTAPALTEEDRVGVAVYNLGRQLRIRREARSYIITIEVSSIDPEKAAAIATRLVDSYTREAELQRRTVIGRTRGAITSSLQSQRESVQAAERAIEDYKNSIGVVDEDGREINSERLRELNRQLLEARNETQVLSAQIEQIEAFLRAPGSPGIVLETLDSPVLTQLRTSYAQVTRERANLIATLGPRHPQVIEINSQVDSTLRAISQETARVSASLRSSYEAAQARTAGLRNDLAELERRTTVTNASLVRLRDLEREAETLRNVFNTYLERERELREQEAIAGNSMTLISEARPASRPVGLNPILLLVGGLGLGGMLGGLAAVAREKLDGRVHSAAGLTMRTGIEAIGELPLSRSLAGSRKSGEAALLIAGTERGSTSARLIHLVSELIDARSGDAQSAVLILAPCATEALSATSLSLALAQAEHGHEVLLVDAQRDPAMDGLMQRSYGGTGGLTRLALEGFEDSPLDIAAVKSTSNSSQLLMTLGYRSLASAFGRYERTIIQAGPQTSDAAMRDLATHASMIVLVLETGRASYSALEEMRILLGRNAGKTIGAVLVERGSDPLVAARTTTTLTAMTAAE